MGALPRPLSFVTLLLRPPCLSRWRCEQLKIENFVNPCQVSFRGGSKQFRCHMCEHPEISMCMCSHGFYKFLCDELRSSCLFHSKVEVLAEFIR